MNPKNKYLPFLLFFISIFGISAQDIPEPMYPFRLVNDFAGIFSEVQKQTLEQKLLAYNDSTSTQIYVVTVSDLGGYPASDYAFQLGEKWEIGQAGKNNGLVILVKPKTSDSRGQAYIATGYGLEEFVNDAYAGRVVRNDMIPYFQQNDYFGGVNAAVDKVIGRLSGEFDGDLSEDLPGIGLGGIIFSFIVIFFFFMLIRRIFGGDQHIDGDGHHRSGGPIFFPPIGSGRSRSSGWGGGGFGGGGFGGFGGGGGGSFGGGGAGGSW